MAFEPFVNESREATLNSNTNIYPYTGHESGNDSPIEIFVDGIYTYFGQDSVQINHVTLLNSQTIQLSQGLHSVSGLTTGESKIFWGDNLKKPDIPEPTRTLFNGF